MGWTCSSLLHVKDADPLSPLAPVERLFLKKQVGAGSKANLSFRFPVHSSKRMPMREECY